MMQWTRLRIPPMTSLLVLANLAGVGLCSARLWHGSEVRLIMARAPLAVDVPAAAREPVRRIVDAAFIRDGALFHEARSFHVTPVGLSAQPPPDYRLSGTVVIPKQPTVAVLVHSQSGVRVKVRAGDTLEGWQVESIEPRVVTLRLADREREIRSAPRPGGF